MRFEGGGEAECTGIFFAKRDFYSSMTVSLVFFWVEDVVRPAFNSRQREEEEEEEGFPRAKRNHSED